MFGAFSYPDEITRRRTSPGSRNEHDEYIPGTTADDVLRANVQPLALADSDFVGGAQLVERLKVYVPDSAGDPLAAAFDESPADQVIYDGKTYVVEESRRWRGSHVRATLLREA